MHLKNDTDRTKNGLFSALCVLYFLSAASGVLDIVDFLANVTETPTRTVYDFNISSGTIFGCCDFVSQSILIYRCWIVWGCNTRVVIIPSILALIFLATWLTGSVGAARIVAEADWGYAVASTALIISMTVNALVMGLIVLKILKVFLGVKATLTEQNLGSTGGRKLQSIIFILIESGMALFSIQLARLVVTILTRNSAAAYNTYLLIAGIHNMLNGITPTIILVRVSMGLSFHDENSLVEATASLCFMPNPNPNPEMGSIAHQELESRDDDIGVRLSNEI